jgi:hypothetical protein
MQSNQEPPRRRDDYAAEAKETFGVGPRAFRRAWDAAIATIGLIGKTRVARKNRNIS